MKSEKSEKAKGKDGWFGPGSAGYDKLEMTRFEIDYFCSKSELMNLLITGGSRGMGKVTAELFAKNGYNIFLVARNPKTLEETNEELSKKYPAVKFFSYAVDLANKAEILKLAAALADQKFVPDILVNNAGIFKPGSISDEPEGRLEEQLAINLYSAYNLTRALLPSMKDGIADGKWRHIFNLCSIAAIQAYPNGGSYSISKFALYGFSKNLREELKPHKIKVTAVLPGAVFTDSWEGFDNSSNRIMQDLDIAQLIFNASQLSPAACVEEIIVRPLLGDL